MEPFEHVGSSETVEAFSWNTTGAGVFSGKTIACVDNGKSTRIDGIPIVRCRGAEFDAQRAVERGGDVGRRGVAAPVARAFGNHGDKIVPA